ncbi:Ovarian-specific serine/threonine-protein kinase Lok [Gryllus bimaculatus]|nr:Ovarian-specific serine/threonine-protein kinase Lok [Gryllus bimaculatus]
MEHLEHLSFNHAIAVIKRSQWHHNPHVAARGLIRKELCKRCTSTNAPRPPNGMWCVGCCQGDSPQPWGYLLPLGDAPPALELRLESTTVLASESCPPAADGGAVGLPHCTAPRAVFTVRRDAASGSASLTAAADGVRLDGQPLPRQRGRALRHGARIALAAEDGAYVFVNRKDSDEFEAPKEVLDRYLVGHCLGSGSFGKVFVLFDKRKYHRRKAMKIVVSDNAKSRKVAKRESQILKSIKHPCVIEMSSVTWMGNRQFLVMQYLAGGDLSRFVNDRRLLSEAQTKLLFFQLALAVQYLHRRSICHRDIKPANILLVQRHPRTLIKVTDFGLAKDETYHSSLRTCAGTGPYRAPETEDDGAAYTLAVDVWSMGVVLFYSLTGALPFKSFYEAMLQRHEVRFAAERWRGVSAQARALAARMLRARAAERASADAVVEDPAAWGSLSRGGTACAGSPEPPPAMSFFHRAPTPWGYLLPQRDGPPPLELRREWAGLHLDQRHALLRDAADEPVSPRVHLRAGLFSVRRDARTGSVALHSGSDLVRLDDEPVLSGESAPLRHGGRISFGREDATYVYVNSKESERLLPTELHGQYLAGNCLGSGSFGNVYVLFEKRMNHQRRALKIIQSKNKKRQMKHAHREGGILTTLKHPCVISVYYDLQVGFQRFLVSEFMAGGDLNQFVTNKHRLSELQTKLIFFQLALAVLYLHDRSICHFNLKPENILLERSDPRTLIKVTDFDLAKGKNGIATLKTIAGSVPYLAPEIISEEYSCSFPADVWSMGVILFYTLTGALPFQNLDEAVLHRHEVDFAQAQRVGVSCHARQLLQAMLKVKSKTRLSAKLVVECAWLRDEAMRKDASELTGLKDIECNTPTPHHRVVYIGTPYSQCCTEREYVYLEGGFKSTLETVHTSLPPTSAPLDTDDTILHCFIYINACYFRSV